MKAAVQGTKVVADRRPVSVARQLWHRFRGPTGPGPDTLFLGDDGLFKELIVSATVYGEYGMGKSTRFVMTHTGCKVLTVDTSLGYIDSLTRELGQDSRLDARFVDVGPIGKWGRPLTYEKRDNFLAYAASIWDRDESPNLVLVDGRFRVTCFLYSVLHAAPGTNILFDDYVARPHYHVVEELIKPVEFCGRQALFVVPDTYDKMKAHDLLEQFKIVWD